MLTHSQQTKVLLISLHFRDLPRYVDYRLLIESMILPPPIHSLAVTYFDAVKMQISDQFFMSTRDSILWQCNLVKHVEDYLLVVPISGLNQCLGQIQFRVVLCYRFASHFLLRMVYSQVVANPWTFFGILRSIVLRI